MGVGCHARRPFSERCARKDVARVADDSQRVSSGRNVTLSLSLSSTNLHAEARPSGWRGTPTIVPWLRHWSPTADAVRLNTSASSDGGIAVEDHGGYHQDA